MLCRKLETDRSGWMTTFLRYGLARPKRVEILLDWNELAEQYGKFLVALTVQYVLSFAFFFICIFIPFLVKVMIVGEKKL